MKINLPLLAALITLGWSGSLAAAPEDATLLTYGFPGCDYTAQTNHFDLGPGQSVQLVLDLSQCSEDYLGGLLYFGYRSTKNSSRPLTRKDGVLLEIMEFGTLQAIDPSDYEGTSDMGFVYIELDHSSLFVLSAVNTNRRKTVRLRLRASSGL